MTGYNDFWNSQARISNLHGRILTDTIETHFIDASSLLVYNSRVIMGLSPGTKLGSYEVLALLGKGGMGEVYKARDARLNRFVAIKVLPEHVSDDIELKQRFEREAQTLASFSHPHICPVFDVGRQDGVDYIVMEFLEGQTLAARLERGALPVEEALKIGIQISDALDKAHRQGIVHRDLKPANVMLTKAGVKLLDFGLAKLKPADQANTLSAAPTRVDITAQGTILGTLQYMAPEQLEGKDADARTDIFAFGTVLYEMVTGKKAFEGKSPASLIGAIMTAEPQSLSQLQPMTPKTLEHVVRTCLAKNPDERWQAAGDLHTQLRWVAANLALPQSLEVRGKRISKREIAAWIVAVGGLVAVFAMWRGNSILVRPESIGRLPAHFPLATPPGVIPFHELQNPGIAISPDGRQLVYAGSSSQGERLYLQDLDRSGPAAPIAGTQGGLNPFFSSDGKWLAFVSNNKLKKVPVTGGEPVVVTEVGSLSRGGVWSPDDETIYFTLGVDTGIWKVPARGGKPAQITKPDRDGFDNGHWWPISILPGGRRLLYTSCCGRFRIMALDLATGERTLLIENGFFAHYVPTGHLVFAQGHSLLAAAFDPDTLKVGGPVKILDNIVTSHEVHGQYAISRTGTLVYFDGTSDFQRQLVRIDRNGSIRQIAKGPRPYSIAMRLAHDGRRLALALYEGQQDVFVYDLVRDDFDRISFDPHNDFDPRWSPDGHNLVFTSVRRGQLDLYITPADKSSPSELLYASDYPKWPMSWSPDGKLLAFNEQRPETGIDIWIYSSEDKKARPFRNASFNEWFPDFSPDGRWLAYSSDELGHYEIYVVPYPGPGPTCKVSIAGGEQPRWSQDGKELFYRRGSAAMVVDVASRNFCSTNPRTLFDGLEPFSWEVSPKGDFFITLEPREPPRLHVVLNWFEELKRLVPSVKK